VGSARTALFNYFIARQSPEGVFLLRIEDTDEERNREEWVDGIVEAMRWLGMSPDEGPFRQSDNRAAHNAAIEALLSNGRL
jgi:glutamyl-tRNA synthetase